MPKLWHCALTLAGVFALAACQSTGENGTASSSASGASGGPPTVSEPPPQGAGTMTHGELLAMEGMEAIEAAEVTQYFSGNTAFWEPIGGSPRMYASYYDPSGSQRLRERRATEVTTGAWRLEGDSFCHRPGDGEEAERCGSFVATPDGLLAFCAEGGRCDWLVVGIDEGNNLGL